MQTDRAPGNAVKITASIIDPPQSIDRCSLTTFGQWLINSRQNPIVVQLSQYVTINFPLLNQRDCVVKELLHARVVT